MGKAIYSMPGLTFQGSLDEFWQSDFKPVKKLYQNFRRYLLDNRQLNGSFYCPKGRQAAQMNFIKKLKYSADILKPDFKTGK